MDNRRRPMLPLLIVMLAVLLTFVPAAFSRSASSHATHAPASSRSIHSFSHTPRTTYTRKNGTVVAAQVQLQLSGSFALRILARPLVAVAAPVQGTSLTT